MGCGDNTSLAGNQIVGFHKIVFNVPLIRLADLAFDIARSMLPKACRALFAFLGAERPLAIWHTALPRELFVKC
jgi:hypothetical protein